MPYTVPTAAQFRAKFPTFAAVADATIALALTDASASVDLEWADADYQPAILYMAAHILVSDGVVTAASDLGSAAGVINAGLVSEMKVGDVMVKLDTGAAGSGRAGSGSTLAGTIYGRRYIDLLRRNKAAVAIV